MARTPLDRAHALDRVRTGGHGMYGRRADITFGSDFQGSYGITTDELSCAGVPGACANP
ncbi:MAG TPA: hypothetical protein VFQ65_11130 [Kofleriaceae bacterium]|nr:hypothetical protein [Kofleriaceae bacterium]